MAKVVFNRFHPTSIENPPPDVLRGPFFSKEFWKGRKSDTVSFDYLGETEKVEKTLIVCYHADHGFYLHFHQGLSEEWVSLADDSRLKEIVEHCGDGDGPVSAGLFLPAEAAWEAVSEFCRTGNRSSRVKWSDMSDFPEEARW
jgi:hypothetical protein